MEKYVEIKWFNYIIIAGGYFYRYKITIYLLESLILNYKPVTLTVIKR